MHEIHGATGTRGCEPRVAVEFRGGDVHEDVLLIIGKHGFVAPYDRTYCIASDIVELRKFRTPIFLPLLVDMFGTTLQGNRRRKQNDRREPRQRCHEPLRRGFRQVLRHLQRKREVEPAIESERRREIRYHEAVVWDEQPFARHVISVDAEDVADPRPQTGREPHSETAADIHYGARRDHVGDQRDDRLGR